MKSQLRLAVAGSLVCFMTFGVGHALADAGVPDAGRGTCAAPSVLEPGTCNCVVPVTCGCPAGFVPSVDRSACVRETVAALTGPIGGIAGTISVGDDDWNYWTRPAYLVNTDSTTQWPFTVSSTATTVVTNAAGNVIPQFGQISQPYTPIFNPNPPPFWVSKA